MFWDVLPQRDPPAGFCLPTQVTEDVHRLLKRCPYHFVCRGKVSVKGKGEMLTYFLEGRTDGNGPGARSLPLDQRLCPYGRGGLQGRRPPLGPAARPPLGPGLPPQPAGQGLPPAAAGKEA